MFGIGGGEFLFIILIVLMLFGSDKVPEIARSLGKGLQQLKNATNDIKGEIHRSADVDNIKKSFTDIGTNIKKNIEEQNITADISDEVKKAKENLEDMSGPIKRIQ